MSYKSPGGVYDNLHEIRLAHAIVRWGQNNQKKENPTSLFKKWGFGVHSIAASFSNRALTRLDVIRYQLLVLGKI